MEIYILPINYNKLHWTKRREVREQYTKEQENNCMHCHCSLSESAPTEITDKSINWRLFPPNFLKYPIHLQHCHKTGMTEGVVHAYCNAVLWQYNHR